MTEVAPRHLDIVEPPLRAYVKPGYNDHAVAFRALATMPKAVVLAGNTFDPCAEARHEGLFIEALRQSREGVLDPRDAELALPGGHTTRLAALPWGATTVQSLEDLDGKLAGDIVPAIATRAVERKYSAVLSPALKDARAMVGARCRLRRIMTEPRSG